MQDHPKISLEQWRTLMAVVDHGGYAQAAQALHKSQSALTYAVQKLESVLGVKAFEIQGRKAILTLTGQLLYRRAKILLEEAVGLERATRALSAGWEAEVRLAAEVIFPSWLMLECLAAFGKESPHTHIEWYESVMGGTQELLLEGKVDLVIAGTVPVGFIGEPLMQLKFVAAAHPDHPLHKLGRELTTRDLRAHRHLVVRDTGTQRSARNVSVEATQRWTMGHLSTSIEAARRGHGFAWYPIERIRDEINEGSLKALRFKEGNERSVQLYLIVADPDAAGPGTTRLAQIIRESVKRECVTQKPAASKTNSKPVTRPRARSK
jgi:DNA-binding transcriptional LysR family regulator